MITNLAGDAASTLGLAAHPNQPPRCVRRAFDRGMNYFFFYGPGNKPFMQQLAAIGRKHRDRMIVATGSGSRKPSGLMSARRKLLAALNTEMIDVFFVEYVTATENLKAVFDDDGVFDELQRWKSNGWIRYVGATTHDRAMAKRLALDSRVDLLMHRFNMAHRKAIREVFPTAVRTRTPVIAFTATRWGTLIEPHDGWSGEPPSAVDCYRYCLAQPAVHLVLTAPQSMRELDENLDVLTSPKMSPSELAHWERFGDLVSGNGASTFETKWP